MGSWHEKHLAECLAHSKHSASGNNCHYRCHSSLQVAIPTQSGSPVRITTPLTSQNRLRSYLQLMLGWSEKKLFLMRLLLCLTSHCVKCFTNRALFKFDNPGVDDTTTFISQIRKRTLRQGAAKVTEQPEVELEFILTSQTSKACIQYL